MPTDNNKESVWANAFAALRFYRQSRGSADVAPRVRAHGIDLGKWVSQCRDDYWDGLLSSEHTRQLESVDEWHWGPNRSGSWRHALHALTHYADRHGTTVLVEHTAVHGVDLQAWTSLQRQSYIALILPATRIELLEELPGWEWDAELARWRQGLAAARLYVQQHRSLASVDLETRLGDFRLGQWIHRCREDHRADTMPGDRAAELEALPGWKWSRYQQNWADGLKILQQYASHTGHAAPGQHTVFEGFAIGGWVAQRRRQRKKGTLKSDHAAILESLPGWEWTPLENKWQRGFSALSAYAAAHGPPIQRAERNSTDTRSETGSTPNGPPAGTAGSRRSAPPS